MYFVVEFIRMGLHELQVSRVERELQNSCSQWDSSPIPCAYKAAALTIVLKRFDIRGALWSYPECAIKIDHVVDVVNVMS